VASIHAEQRNGKTHYRVQFYNKDNRRKSIRLGRVQRRAADAIRVKIEHLVSASIGGTPLDGETSRWLKTIGDNLAAKLAGAGLVLPRESATLAAFIDAYIASRTDARPNTARNFKTARRFLVDHFGADRRLRSIGPGDCDEWRQEMVQNGLAEATISKQVKTARQFFKLACRKGLIDANPFQDVKAGSQRNEARLRFIDRATIEKVLDAAPNPEWRLIIALARFGGVRTPSESLALKWSDVDWAANRFIVPSPKTAHQGKPFRIVPLFPELRPYLEAAFEAAPDGAVYVIGQFRDTTQNLRTQLLRILRRAGVEPWPRSFHNLRASRQTELADQFPLHVVTDWIGNSPEVADRHYLKTTEDHFRRAAADDVDSVGKEGVQQWVQQAAESDRTMSQTQNGPPSKGEPLLNLATVCDSVQDYSIPPRGVEPRFSD
jgi:integrase